jgi:hypothetical protein
MFMCSALLDGLETRQGPISARRADPYRMVRRFYRSGTENLHYDDVDGDVRDLDQLRESIAYLLAIWRNVIRDDEADAKLSSSGVDLLDLAYSFIMDRLAAVRQDLVMHHLKLERGDDASSHRSACMDILVSILRFYAHSEVIIARTNESSRSSSSSSSWFSTVLHRKAFNAALAGALDLANRDETTPLVDELYAYYLLGNQLNLLQDAFTSSSRMSEALARLAAADNLFPHELRLEARVISAKSSWCSMVWKLIVALRCGNASRALRLVERLVYEISYPIGIRCMAMQLLPEIRIMRLLLMNRAANKEVYPIADLCERLRLSGHADGSEQCLQLCQALQIPLKEDATHQSIVLNDASIGNDPSITVKISRSSLMKNIVMELLI